jgi:putative DNA primase/helicase
MQVPDDQVDPGARRALDALELAYSDHTIAKDFADYYGHDYRFCAERDSWMWWDEFVWRRDDQLRAMARVQEVCLEHARQARRDSSVGSEQKQAGLARQLASYKTFKAVELSARAMERVSLSASLFDRDPWVLNTPGGLVNLRLGVVRDAVREDYCTRSTAVALDEHGEHPAFDQFLDDVTCGDPELVDWLQVFLGMMLTGDTSMHVLPMFIGSGRNGKSTLADLVLRIMGDYAAKIPSSVLMTDRHGNRHPTEIAQLMGIRLALASEVDQGSFWDEAKLKELTGDETLTARFMRGDFFSFRRTHRFLVLGNYRPQVKAVDPAIRGRLRLVPFRADFSGREDRTLPDRLWREAGAILRWMVNGAQAWAEDQRLPACSAIERETGDYFESQSTVDNWIDLELDQSDPAARTQSGVLYRAYREWKESRGEYPLSQTTWSQTMARRFKRVHSNGVRYVGVTLREQLGRDDGELPL